MSAITYGAAAPSIPRKAWFRRLIEAIHESQMRKAEREIARHEHLLPNELERAGFKLDRRSEDSLPFVR